MGYEMMSLGEWVWMADVLPLAPSACRPEPAMTSVKQILASAVAGTGKTGPVMPPSPPKKEWLDRDEAIRRIREGLKARSGKTWSVKGGRGTAWGWLKISAPPKRCTAGDFGYMTPEDCAELGRLLGLKGPVHFQGESVPASSEHYWEYVDRAEGVPPRCFGTMYWD